MRSAERIQAFVLSTKGRWPFAELFALYYRLSLKIFLWGLRGVEKRCGGRPVVRVFLRRGGGRGELVPGASDLDFFIEITPLHATEEMRFLKEFWTWFRWHKQKLFPFWGEALMADSSELVDFFQGRTFRAAEAPHSWQLLRGEPMIWPDSPSFSSNEKFIDGRDLFSEGAKCYWQALHCYLNGPLKDHPWKKSIALRNCVKALLDLDRLYSAFLKEKPVESLLAPNRNQWIRMQGFPVDWERLLRAEILEEPVIKARFEELPSFLWLALQKLDAMAKALSQEDQEPRRFFQAGDTEEGGIVSDSFSVSLRELFVERLLRRNRKVLRKALISDGTTHIYLPLEEAHEEDFCRLLADLRSAEMADAGVLLPVTAAILEELPRTSFLDSPFHGFLAHQKLSLEDNGRFQSTPYEFGSQEMPLSVLEKTFAETSLTLRFQPPNDFFYAIHLVTLVLQLRVAEDGGKVPVSFHRALKHFSDLQPRQGQFLKEKLGLYLGLGEEQEDRFWRGLEEFWTRFGADGPRAALLWAQLGALRAARKSSSEGLREKSTDLWIELTPFLRLEMQAMRERYLKTPCLLKV